MKGGVVLALARPRHDVTAPGQPHTTDCEQPRLFAQPKGKQHTLLRLCLAIATITSIAIDTPGPRTLVGCMTGLASDGAIHVSSRCSSPTIVSSVALVRRTHSTYPAGEVTRYDDFLRRCFTFYQAVSRLTAICLAQQLSFLPSAWHGTRPVMHCAQAHPRCHFLLQNIFLTSGAISKLSTAFIMTTQVGRQPIPRTASTYPPCTPVLSKRT
jgi:hypothetical protein